MMAKASRSVTPGDPEQRIAALKRRIAYLVNQLQELDAVGARQETGASKVAHDLAETRQQLARYQALNEGRN
jgi:hypothetical protein